MLRLLFFLFFVLLHLEIFAQSPNKKFFGFDGYVQSINLMSINNFDYFSFDDLTRANISKALEQNYIYSFGKNTLFFLPGSRFFFLIDKYDNKHQYQMVRPTFLLGDKLLIPLGSFLDCLSNSNLFETSFSNKSFAFKFKESKKENIGITPQKETIGSKSRTQNNKGSGLQEDNKEETTSPNESTKIPKLVLTNYERFSLIKSKATGEDLQINPNKEIVKPKKDTAGKIPPKFYVLPPQLKNKSE